MPKISVVVPVYKVEKYLRRCVDSILCQSFYDFTLILVDDGSPDNCPAMCDEYAEKDKRVVVIHRENGGLSAARNSGLDYIFDGHKTEWVTFIDSDDWVNKEYLLALFDVLQKYGADISACHHTVTYGEEPDISNDTVKIGEFSPEDYWYLDWANATIACSKLYKTELWKEIRFPFGKIHEDAFTTHKLLFAAEKIALVSQKLYNYYINPDGITHSTWSIKRLDDVEACAEQVKFFEKRSPTLAAKAIDNYFMHLANAIEHLENMPEYKELRNGLIAQLRADLRKYGKMAGYSIFANHYVYKCLYPKITKVLLFVKCLIKRT